MEKDRSIGCDSSQYTEWIGNGANDVKQTSGFWFNSRSVYCASAAQPALPRWRRQLLLLLVPDKDNGLGWASTRPRVLKDGRGEV